MLAFIALFAALGITEFWFIDFEYGIGRNKRPIPLCLAAYEAISGRSIQLWLSELTSLTAAPFNVGRNALIIAYAAAAEIDVFLELGWPVPHNILCMWTEFIMITNGILKRPQHKTRLIDAQTYYGQAAIAFEEKEEMQELARQIAAGANYTEEDRRAEQKYNMEDVTAMVNLAPAMTPDLAKFHPREILFRGRATTAQARGYRVGIPVDVEKITAVGANCGVISGRIIHAAEAANKWGIYTKDGVFNHANYEAWLKKQGIKMPPTDTGQASVADDELEKLEERHPELKPLRACIKNVSLLSRLDVNLDEDGRIRIYVNPYGSDRLRNQPSTSSFPFSWPKWARYFLKPEPGYGMEYLDASGQEFLIGYGLSGDRRMGRDYETSDVHMQVAKALALVPKDATKKSHSSGRQKAKGVVYGSNYGQTKFGLRNKIGGSLDRADAIQKRYRKTYEVYYRWVQGILNGLKLHPKATYYSRLGSPLWTGGKNRRQLMNHPLQCAGSDWLRLVAIACSEAGIDIAATVHDALLIVAPTERLKADADTAELIMKAAAIALFGAPVRVDRQTAVWPDRFIPEDDETAADTWNFLLRELAAIEAEATTETLSAVRA